MQRNLPHLVIASPQNLPFTTAKTGGGAPSSLPVRNRQQHSDSLKKQLTKAWEKAANEQVVYHSNRQGIYLEFKGEEGHELASQSLEKRSGKTENQVRLLNVRTETVTINAIDPNGKEQQEIETTFATIFVPNSQKKVFFKKIADYATQNSPAGKPLNANLIDRISRIRNALEIESFWLDSKDLIPGDNPEWCEVWLSSDDDEILKRFRALLEQHEIEFKPGSIRFPERRVKLICASYKQLETITRLSDDIAEYRHATETSSFWVEQPNSEQAEWVQDLCNRLEHSETSDVALCILDGGVNHGHPLLTPLLSSANFQSVDPAWGTDDHSGHGTLMAGLSAYGNLEASLSTRDPLRVKHCLESVKILPSTGHTKRQLWGYMTAQGVSKAEIQAPKKRRTICMAVTGDSILDDGRPSSWSATLDSICSGDTEGIRRLFLVCAGNCKQHTSGSPEDYIYPVTQQNSSILDPAQSWNALTVGAYTQLDQIQDNTLSDYSAIAPAGGLSPFSTTSWSWDNSWPIKPEIVMEGGNLAKDGIPFITECDDFSLLSTHHIPHISYFSTFNMTSAATAQAAWFAAQIQAEYPDYWPETIRALMVHSAEWTDTMKQQFLANELKGSYLKLIRTCGYGVPNLERALFSARNSLTLVAQSEIQPYDKKEKGGYCTKDMHLYELPWPKEILENLPPSTKVKMRVTLSYFIEPGPGELGHKNRYRYPSHGLQFKLNSAGEDKPTFTKRINKAMRDKGELSPGTPSPSDNWTIGQSRDKGSIHSDIWTGYASDLALSNLIAIHPIIGWWRERAYLNKWNKKTHYSLIVSITTEEQDVDIYTSVATQIAVPIPVEVRV